MEREKLTALVAKAKAGDREALNELFAQTYNDVYYFALKTVKDEDMACDITQETFITVFKTIDSLQEPASYVAWCRQITYRHCLHYMGKNREVTVEEEEDGSSIFDTVAEENAEFIPDAALDKEDFRKTVMKMVDSLTPEQRTAILLYYYDELSVREIAQIQGVSEGTVKSRLNYGRKAIKASVEDYEKKNNVKLHCVGVLPLLLWLFASDVSACSMTAATAGTVATGVSAATGTTLSITSLVKNGAKAVWTLWQKIIAGLAATAVAIGGTVAVVYVINRPAEQEVQVWQGQGSITVGLPMLSEVEFVLEVEEMDETHIKGKLSVSPKNGTSYQRNFEGTGRVSITGVTNYTIKLDESVEGYVLTDSYTFPGYSELSLLYKPEEDTFKFFPTPYEVVLKK